MICVKRENIYIWKIPRTNYHVSFRTLLELYSNAVENNPQRINAENIDTPYNTLLPYPILPSAFSFYRTIPLPSLARGW